MFRSRLSGLLAVPFLLGGVAQAEEDERIVEEVYVVAHPLSAEGLSQPAEVLQGAELEQKVATNIGETLALEPGVHSAQFGNAVGRPVIHGVGGPRVRIMEDRIDALDVSVTSADHAVTVEPFIAERIEVLKGSSALLYGSGAIGGVVDVHTGRIPHYRAETPFSGGIETRFDSNTDGYQTAAKLNGGGGNFAWHLDGTWKDGDDYEIPGFAESKRLRALEEEEHEEEEEEEEEEHHDEEEVRDELPGSAFDSKSYAAGASYVGDWGFVGVAVSEIDADYGLPGGHGHGHEHEEEEEEEEEEHHEDEEGTPTLDMEQTRIDVELGFNEPFGPGPVSSINVRLGVNDYEHQEIEPDGEPATTFLNEAWELRSELAYEYDDWQGAIGVQVTDIEFSASGEEATIPEDVGPIDTTERSFFWLAERNFDDFDLETGVRLGRVQHRPRSGTSEAFTVYAATLGVVVPLSDELLLGVIADHSSRAPVAMELYANGPHIVTNAFEIGDTSLDSEKATGLSGTLTHAGETWRVAATAYYTMFDGFIYEQRTDEDPIDDLPVYRFVQEDADFIGVDLEVSTRIAEFDGGHMELRGMFDYVRGTLDVSGNDDLPRISPMRYGIGLTGEFGPFTASIDLMRVEEQDDVADEELPTDEYDDLRVYLGAEFQMGSSALDVFIVGKNLTDDEQRYHTSFIKDFAPAPGRTVEAGVRLVF